jgi:[NiFe] hydrogenase assembly HybE family chaperone
MSELNHLILKQLAQIKQHYQAVDERMQGLPLYHPNLEIEVLPAGWVSFHAGEFEAQGLLAGIITPWCINALLLPLAWPLHWPYRVGSELEVALPADTYVMLANEGGFLTLSLMAETRQLADQEAAQVFLRTALELLKQAPPEPEAVQSTQSQAASPEEVIERTLNKSVSRRGLLGRG